MTPTPSTTRKPMAAAIRTFVAGMKFPPAPEHGPNPNVDLATFTITMLQFATGMTEGCTEITVSPAVSYIAGLIHGSDSTVKRRLKALRQLGLLTVKERGHFSTTYTFHQNPARSTVDLAAAGSTVGTARKRQRGQPPSPAGSTIRPARSTRRPAGSTVDPLWSKAFGSSLEKTPLEKEGESGSGSFSEKQNQSTEGSVPEGFRLDEAGDLVAVAGGIYDTV